MMSIVPDKGPVSNRLERLLFFPVTRIVLGGVACVAAMVAFQNLISKPAFRFLISEQTIADTLIHYCSVAVLLITYIFVFRFYEKRKIDELSVKHISAEGVGGFFLGFGMMSLTVLILYLLGYYSVDGFGSFNYMLSPFSFLVIAALLEEVVFRLIIYRILENWIGTYMSLLANVIVFTVPHMYNDNTSFLSTVMTILFACAHGIMFTYTKRVWLPFAFHLGWNFAQPFYGSHLSGIEDIGFMVNGSFKGPELLTGSAFGIEDSVFSIVYLAVLIFVFIRLSIKRGKIDVGDVIRNLRLRDQTSQKR